MKNKCQLVIGMIACLFLAVLAYLWAINLMQSLYAYRSPLSKAPPIPGESTEPSITSKVVIILIDALRVDTAFNPEIMPFLNSMKINSAWGTMHSQPPSYSEPGWTTILTGAWPEISDGPAMNLEYEDIYPFTQDNIFSAAHRIGLRTAISGYYWFEKLLPPGIVDMNYYTKGEDNQADQEVIAAALPWLSDNTINLILIHIDQVDYAGHHEGGPSNKKWDEAATRADNLVQVIVDELDMTKDAILILSDHGQIDSGGHGGQEEVVLTEPYLFSGRGIIPGNYPDIDMVDIAPTISVLLGLSIPAANQGQPLLQLLTIDSAKIKQIELALSAQQKQLYNSYTSAINSKIMSDNSENNVISTQRSISLSRDMRLRSEIIGRLIILIILFGIFALIVFRLIKIRLIMPYLLSASSYVLIFNYHYFLVNKLPYSLSWINSQRDLFNFIIFSTLLSFTISWILFIILTKTFHNSPIEVGIKSLVLSITTIFITSIPVSISFVINGPLVMWTLPNISSMYLAFLSLLQCLLLAIFGCILSALSIPLIMIVRNFVGENNYGSKLNN